MRTLRTTLVPVALTAALALGLTGCGGSDGPSTASGGSSAAAGGDAPVRADAASLVRAAGAASTRSGSSRLSLVSSTQLGTTPFEVKGDGLFAYGGEDGGEGTLKLSLPTGSIDEKIVGGKVYLALSQDPGSYYVLDLKAVQGTSIGGSTDPAASFAALDAVDDDVTKVGTEQVRGTSTTHYKGTVDVQKALSASTGAARQLAEATLGRSGQKTLPFDVWLDADGRVRRYVQALDIPASQQTGGQAVKTTTTVELYDFGVDVEVSPPPASQQKDGTPLLKAFQQSQAATGSS